mmetsp:Transcript_25845/g.53442  ORF Transcript_25845/g.53442 Transcript_25845/m.53442 type:complete len:119 (-) Transcript_25845:1288-1644(-)
MTHLTSTFNLILLSWNGSQPTPQFCSPSFGALFQFPKKFANILATTNVNDLLDLQTLQTSNNLRNLCHMTRLRPILYTKPHFSQVLIVLLFLFTGKNRLDVGKSSMCGSNIAPGAIGF